MSLLETLLGYLPGFSHATTTIGSIFSAIPGYVWAWVYVLWLVVSVSYILMQRRTPTATLAWVIGFLSLPYFGAVLYFFFGPRKLARRKLRRAMARRLAEKSIGGELNVLPRGFEHDTPFSSLARLAVMRNDASPVRASSVELFDTGDGKYASVEQAMRAATKHIHIEYYIFEPDEIGTRWRDLLIERAKAGVKVRVLLDALGSKNCSRRWFKGLTKAGGEVRYFNPPAIIKHKPGRLNFRTHRKIVVIDGSISFTGGINVCNDHSALSCGPDAWRDTHLRVDGNPARDLQMIFLEDWMFAKERDTTWAILNRDLADAPNDLDTWFPDIQDSASGPWVQVIDSGPDESVADVHRYFFTAITLAQHRVWITTPYFVPDEPMLTALVTAKARGVDVRLIIPAKGDSMLVTAAASTFASQVAQEGISVYCYGPTMNHAKTMVIDNDLAVVGTANMDNRSFRLNFEVIAAVYDQGFNEQLAEMFTEDMRHTRKLIPGENDGSFAQRLLASGARLFAPLL
jgi:cardiolipin synthase